MKSIIEKLKVMLFLILLTQTGIGYSIESRIDPQVVDSLAAITDDPLAKSDLFDKAWMYEKSVNILKETGKKDAETLWRLARAHINQGENLDEAAALALFEMAVAEARQAVRKDGNSALAHQTLATALGRVALYKGVFKSIGLVKEIHFEALKSVSIGDSVPVAYYILGKTHKKLIEKPGFVRKMLGLGWASEDSVANYFENALKISAGNMIQCCVEYADFLLNSNGKEDKIKAETLLREALNLPLRDEQDQDAHKRARSLLVRFSNQ